MLKLSLDRDFRRLLVGQGLTMLGDSALIIMLAVWASQLTGSASAGGAVFFLLALPGLAAPVAGWLIDRCSRRRLLIANDLFTAASLLPLFAVQDRHQVWVIYLAAIAYGLSQQVFFATRSALVQSLLAAEQLSRGNALLEALRQAARLAGPLAGTALFATLGGRAVVALDVATFLVSAVCLTGIHGGDCPERVAAPSAAAELSAGARHIARTPALRRLVGTFAAALAVVGLLEVAVLALVSEGLHRPAAFLGVIVTAEGAGAIAGGLLAGSRLRRCRDLTMAAIGMAGMGVGAGAMAASAVAPVLAGAMVVGAGLAVFVVGYTTALQRRTEPGLQGRVATAAEAIVGVPLCVSLAVATAAVATIDYRLVLALNAAVMCACAVYLLAGTRDELVEAVEVL